MKKWFKKNLLFIIGAFAGAIAGYLYYQQIGCASGTCMTTSKPVNSILYGALMGGLIFGMFKRENKNQSLKKQNKLNHDV